MTTLTSNNAATIHAALSDRAKLRTSPENVQDVLDVIQTYGLAMPRSASAIPAHMMGGLRRWIEHGVMPGSFLRAVLENNLKDAVGQADSTNQQLLVAYVIFLYNEAPAACWGSPEKVRAWAEAKAAERAALTGGGDA